MRVKLEKSREEIKMLREELQNQKGEWKKEKQILERYISNLEEHNW